MLLRMYRSAVEGLLPSGRFSSQNLIYVVFAFIYSQIFPEHLQHTNPTHVELQPKVEVEGNVRRPIASPNVIWPWCDLYTETEIYTAPLFPLQSSPNDLPGHVNKCQR